MYVSTLAHAHIGARPVGVFAGMGVMGAMIGSGRAAGWQAGSGPPGGSLGGSAVSRVLPEQQGAAACGAKSTAKGGKDGAEPFNIEGCGCGGGCGPQEDSADSQCGTCEAQRLEHQGHPAGQTLGQLFVAGASTPRGAESGVRYRKTNRDGKADIVTKEEADAYKAAQEMQQAAADAVAAVRAADAQLFATHFEIMDCRNIAKYGSPWGLDPSTPMGIPPAAFAQPCADAPSADDATPFSANWGDCVVPMWNEYGGTDPCGAFAPSVERTGVDCSAIENEMLAHGRAMLMLNMDIVKWAICLGYGDEDVDGSAFAIYTNFINVVLHAGLHCDNLKRTAVASAALDISFNSANIQGWIDRWRDGDPFERLCVTVHVAHTLFHEMMHVAVGIGSSDWSAVAPPCHPMWLAQSVVKTALVMRYPQARKSACCDDCLSNLFWFAPANGSASATSCAVDPNLVEFVLY